MANYRLTSAAKSDLLGIWEYTVKIWGKKQAEKYLLDIESQLEQLATNPELGRKRPEIKPGYHSFPVEQHVIFYMKSNLHIDIIGILHKRMDIDKNLTKPATD